MQGASYLRRLAAVCLIAAFATLGASGQARGAHLDRGFGKGGIRYLPQDLRELGGAALMRDGRVLVGNEREIRALLPSGRFDPTFGDGGSVRLRTGAGSVGGIFGFAVDAEGRPVLLGSSGKSTGFRSVVERFTPQGGLDRSFGAGRGFVLTDFGLPLPETGKRSSDILEDVAFDPTGRLLVMGRAPIGTRPGPAKDGPSTVSVEEAFVARFGASGELDRSFAKGGVFRDKGIELLSGGFRVDESLNRD